MKLWIAVGIACLVALAVIILVAVLERKPYSSQRTRIGEGNVTTIAWLSRDRYELHGLADSG